MVEPTVWEFKLRPNVKFHNGDSFTADDVKFSLERATRYAVSRVCRRRGFFFVAARRILRYMPNYFD